MIFVFTIGSLYWSSASYQQRDWVQQCTTKETSEQAKQISIALQIEKRQDYLQPANGWVGRQTINYY